MTVQKGWVFKMSMVMSILQWMRYSNLVWYNVCKTRTRRIHWDVTRDFKVNGIGPLQKKVCVSVHADVLELPPCTSTRHRIVCLIRNPPCSRNENETSPLKQKYDHSNQLGDFWNLLLNILGSVQTLVFSTC